VRDAQGARDGRPVQRPKQNIVFALVELGDDAQDLNAEALDLGAPEDGQGVAAHAGPQLADVHELLRVPLEALAGGGVADGHGRTRLSGRRGGPGPQEKCGQGGAGEAGGWVHR